MRDRFLIVRPLIIGGKIAMTQPETPLPARELSMRRIIRATIGGVIAAIAGLAAVVIVGMLAWEAVVGPVGAIIAAVIGALLGGILRGFGDWPVRSLAGAVGGAVGGFCAIAAAEQSPPGSAEWAVHGGLLGAVFAVPVAAVVAVAAGAIAALVRPRT
jgi:hypothetical protein